MNNTSLSEEFHKFLHVRASLGYSLDQYNSYLKISSCSVKGTTGAISK